MRASLTVGRSVTEDLINWTLSPPEAPFSDWSSAWYWTALPEVPTPWSYSIASVRTTVLQTRQAQIYDLHLHAAAVVMPSLFPWHPFGWTQELSFLLNTVPESAGHSSLLPSLLLTPLRAHLTICLGCLVLSHSFLSFIYRYHICLSGMNTL